MKICIVTPSLGLGGAERSAAIQSVMFSNLGYEVHVVTITDIINYDYAGALFNLGAFKDKRNSVLNKVKRSIMLRKYLNTHQFDFIVDNRMRTNGLFNEVSVCKYVYRGFKVVYVIHSSAYINDFKNSPVINEWLLQDAYQVVAVNPRLCESIKSLYKKRGIICVENAVDLEAVHRATQSEFDIDYPYILYCGRLDEHCKNISLLIKGYAKSQVYNSGVKLIILGDGLEKPLYEQMVTDLNITEHVVFKPFTNNPFVYMKQAICTVLTSLYEGFALVLIESLATGTPVIATNCETGPSEIINHNENGLLLDSYDDTVLADAIKKMVNDQEWYQQVKANALDSVAKFSKDAISKKWQMVFEKV
ncbi:glycosyltransferase [Tamlana haliotis]|uniref:Glycosyltransferase n=1 Tax=Pseudotamlana haliotis TaxID=2614804 RepID=A0A6N6MC64_9FLAO|nr:glycosyltransferase [Tamlana haliotis]KAB1068218.1 glycosyltransferase [Tamlana haliotis]